MAQMEYQRDDFRIVMRRSSDGGVLVQFPGEPVTRRVKPKVVRTWIAQGISQPISDLAKALGVAQRLKKWSATQSPSGSGMTLRRVALDVADPELAALPWEQALAPLLQPHLRRIVRTSDVLPRHGSTPFTMPMRILQVGHTSDRPIAQIVRHVFGSHPAENVERIVTVGSCNFDEIAHWRLDADWPTAEIIHFDEYPLLDARLLSKADPETPGTLSWLSRLTSTWQTRLVVLHVRNVAEAMAARTLASALTGVAGPAVLVAELGTLTPGWYYQEFYEALIHDAPLDQCAFPWALISRGSGREERLTLFVGAGREEALRFSSLGVALIGLNRDLQGAVVGKVTSRGSREKGAVLLPKLVLRQPTEGSAGLANLLRRTTAGSMPILRQKGTVTKTGGMVLGNRESEAFRDVLEELGSLETNWNSMTFDFHERDGVIPLGKSVEATRRAARITRAVIAALVDLAPDAPRFVNAHLAVADTLGRVSRLPQDGEPLVVFETYQLEIDIGPQDISIRVVGSVPILEEYFRWTPEMKGVWLEIGITGIDFKVVGDPVQELWLARQGPTVQATFAVIPQTIGIAQLRFCIYHRNNVIQSFRVATATRLPEAKSFSATSRAEHISKALGLPRTIVSSTSWLARMEYAIAADVRDSTNSPERAISIVANALNGGGRTIVTVKGKGEFRVRDDIGDSAQIVSRVRETFEALSVKVVPQKTGEAKRQYLYGAPGKLNAGDEDKLKPALMTLAELGWELLDKVFPGGEKERASLLALLDGQGKTVHVAHMQLTKVIPWAAMYLREYDAGQEEVERDGKFYPAAHDACLASLPDDQGHIPDAPCGVLETCVLNEARVKARLAKDGTAPALTTVACPRAFLGFRHILELPAQQVNIKDDQSAAASSSGAATTPNTADATLQQRVIPLCTEITVGDSARLAMGINATLNLAGNHEKELGKLCSGPPVRATPLRTAYSRDAVLRTLRDPNLDLIYFFCHARGGPGSAIDPPVLEFQMASGKSGSFDAARVGAVTWSHHPLVMLNACNTVGFSPSTISPFIVKFVQDCQASGVIGTEIPVYEELSTEFAERFFGMFLAGEQAGPALLRARRSFLTQLNPLGLVYTLYAASELHIVSGAASTRLVAK